PMRGLEQLAARAVAGAPADRRAAPADARRVYLLQFDRRTADGLGLGLTTAVAQAIAHVSHCAAHRQTCAAALQAKVVEHRAVVVDRHLQDEVRAVGP